MVGSFNSFSRIINFRNGAYPPLTAMRHAKAHHQCTELTQFHCFKCIFVEMICCQFMAYWILISIQNHSILATKSNQANVEYSYKTPIPNTKAPNSVAKMLSHTAQYLIWFYIFENQIVRCEQWAVSEKCTHL